MGCGASRAGQIHPGLSKQPLLEPDGAIHAHPRGSLPPLSPGSETKSAVPKEVAAIRASLQLDPESESTAAVEPTEAEDVPPPTRVARVQTLAGRTGDVDWVVRMLTQPSSRVVIHGGGGVGKATVMAEVAESADVRRLGGLQAWLHAESEPVFRQQLLHLFRSCHPEVIREHTKAAAALKAIKAWLASEPCWVLFIEGATEKSATFFDLLPKSGGRVVVTARSLLQQLPLTAELLLEPLRTCESIDLFRKLDVFAVDPGRKASKETHLLRPSPRDLTDPPPSTVLNGLPPLHRGGRRPQRSLKVAPAESKPRKDSTRNDGHSSTLPPLLSRLPRNGSSPKADVGTADLRAAKGRSLGESSSVSTLPILRRGSRKARRKSVGIEERELSRPDLATFLETVLCNLPLSVALCGHAARADPLIRGVDDLIPLFEDARAHTDLAAAVAAMQSDDGNAVAATSLGGRAAGSATANADNSTRRRSEDQQVAREDSGLLCAVIVATSRLKMDTSLPDGDRINALRLLTALSILDSTLTPWWLLLSSGIFADERGLERARATCVKYGLVQPTDAGEGWVGVVHRRVQRCLRWVLIPREQSAGSGQSKGNCEGAREAESHLNTSTAEAVVTKLRSVFDGLFLLDKPTPLGSWAKCRGLLGVVDSWCAVHDSGPQYGPLFDAPEALEACLRLQCRCTVAVWRCAKDTATARVLAQRTLDRCRAWLPPAHPLLSVALNNLGVVNACLGAHVAAQRLLQAAGEVQRHALPSGHPAVEATLGSLASTHTRLGQHEEACHLKTELLHLRVATHPPDHPDIRTTKASLATTYTRLALHEDALRLKTEVVAAIRESLPPEHPEVAAALSRLATEHAQCGYHGEALVLHGEALGLKRRTLPPAHPDVRRSMVSLIETYSALGRHEEALQLQGEVLAFLKQTLPEGHPDVAAVMNRMASTHSTLGHPREAFDLRVEVLALERRARSPQSPRIGVAMYNLAGSYSERGRHDEALRLTTAALEVIRNTHPPSHPHIGAGISQLGTALSHLGQHDAAHRRHGEALAFRRQHLPATHPDIAASMNNVAVECWHLGQADEARALQTAAVARYKELLPPEHPTLAGVRRTLETMQQGGD